MFSKIICGYLTPVFIRVAKEQGLAYA